MIRNHIDRCFRTFEFRTPLFESANNCHKFLVIYLIIALGWIMFLREVSNWVKDTVLSILGQNSPRYIIRGVCFDDNRQGGIVVAKNSFGGKGRLQSIECFLAFRGPFKWHVFLGQIGKRSGKFTVPIDEPSIEVRKA